MPDLLSCENCSTIARNLRVLRNLRLCEGCFRSLLEETKAASGGPSAQVGPVTWFPLDCHKLEHVSEAMEAGEWLGKYLTGQMASATQEQSLLNWAEALAASIRSAISERMVRRGFEVVRPVRTAAAVAASNPANGQHRTPTIAEIGKEF